MTSSIRSAEQERVDQPEQARDQDRHDDDDDLGPVGPEERDDPADRLAAALLRHRGSISARPGHHAELTPASTPRKPQSRAAAAAPAAHHGRGGARLGDALRLEPALGVDRRPAAVAGGGDRLAVAVVVDVAGDEDAVDLGGRCGRGPRGSPSRRPRASRGRPRCWAGGRSRRTGPRPASSARRRSPCRAGGAPRRGRRRGPPRRRC